MKIKSVLTLILVLFCLVAFSSTSMASSGHHTKKEKKGILLVAFGSSIPKAQVSFTNIDKQVKKQFKKIPVKWAYTSSIIRHKLAKQGQHLDSVEVALAKMMDEGFTHVAVQSLHTITGEEYEDLLKTVAAFKMMPETFDKITVGSPLLASSEDINNVTDAIIKNIPKKRRTDEAVVLMGHGSPHSANSVYAALMFNLQQKDPNIFVGTVEGKPEIDEIKYMLTKNGIKKAYLIPFMSVAGDHAINDMASDEDDSWKSVLGKSGIKCTPVLKGTAEYNNMVQIWIDHLKVAFSELG